jgi:hypothetical protein
MQHLLLFIYLPTFETAAEHLLDETARHALELELLADPDAGAIVSGTRGVRKLRIALTGRGKRGGARVIYYHRGSAGRIYLLFAYGKNEAATLSPAGKAMMRSLVRCLEEES